MDLLHQVVLSRGASCLNCLAKKEITFLEEKMSLLIQGNTETRNPEQIFEHWKLGFPIGAMPPSELRKSRFLPRDAFVFMPGFRVGGNSASFLLLLLLLLLLLYFSTSSSKVVLYRDTYDRYGIGRTEKKTRPIVLPDRLWPKWPNS